MSNIVKIFCEECGAPLEVDEADPRIFCDQCGAEVENIKYNPNASSASQTIFSVNTIDEEPTYEEEYEDEYNEEPSVDNIKETFTKAFQNVATAMASGLGKLEDHIKSSVKTSTTTTHHESYTFKDEDEDEDDVKTIFVDHEYVEDVTEGTPVTYYAVIERRGRFFTGECPEVPFTTVDQANSFEECVEEIKDELEERVNSFGGKDYPQPSYEDLQSDYPQADIIEVTVYKKR